MDNGGNNCRTKQPVSFCEPCTFHRVVSKCGSLAMKATREGAICNRTLAQRWNALSTTRCLTTAALPPDVLRLRRSADIVFGEADPPESSFLQWAVSPAATCPHSSLLLPVWDYRCAFSSCRCTCFFSLRTSVNWLWRSGSWDFCGLGWWLLCLPCQYSGPGCFASPILNSSAFSSC